MTAKCKSQISLTLMYIKYAKLHAELPVRLEMDGVEITVVEVKLASLDDAYLLDEVAAAPCTELARKYTLR